MASNITNPIYLQRYVCSAFTYVATTAVEACTVVLRTGVAVPDGTTIPDGVAGNDAAIGEAFSLVTGEIAIVKVADGEAITYNAPIAVESAGRVRVGVPGTDVILGKALDTSDGSGTALEPHYIRVQLTAF